MVGVGQHGVLAHARPAQLIGVGVRQVDGALGDGDGAEVDLGVKAHLLGLLLQGLRPQVVGQLGKVHVAGVAQSRGHILAAVGVAV